MLTRILHQSSALGDFVEALALLLSQPQRRHVGNLADALVVCDGAKTLAQLQRQFVASVDVSNLADTLRIAPWTAPQVRRPVGALLVRAAVAQAQAAGTLDYITVSLDDSLAPKHKETRHLEPVDWHFDHGASTPGQPVYVNGAAYLGCNLWIGGFAVTFEVRRYLREQTVRRLNRSRCLRQRISFPSKFELARLMLQRPADSASGSKAKRSRSRQHDQPRKLG